MDREEKIVLGYQRGRREPIEIVAELENLRGKKAIIYTTDQIFNVYLHKCTLIAFRFGKFNQYPESVSIFFRYYRKHNRNSFTGCRGSIYKDHDGVMRDHGNEFLVVPGWGEDLRIDQRLSMDYHQPNPKFTEFAKVLDRAFLQDNGAIAFLLDDSAAYHL